MDNKKYYTAKEANQLLGFGKDMINKLIYRGEVTAEKKGGRYYISQEEFKRLKKIEDNIFNLTQASDWLQKYGPKTNEIFELGHISQCKKWPLEHLFKYIKLGKIKTVKKHLDRPRIEKKELLRLVELDYKIQERKKSALKTLKINKKHPFYSEMMKKSYLDLEERVKILDRKGILQLEEFPYRYLHISLNKLKEIDTSRKIKLEWGGELLPYIKYMKKDMNFSKYHNSNLEELNKGELNLIIIGAYFKNPVATEVLYNLFKPRIERLGRVFKSKRFSSDEIKSLAIEGFFYAIEKIKKLNFPIKYIHKNMEYNILKAFAEEKSRHEVQFSNLNQLNEIISEEI